MEDRVYIAVLKGWVETELSQVKLSMVGIVENSSPEIGLFILEGGSRW